MDARDGQKMIARPPNTAKLTALSESIDGLYQLTFDLQSGVRHSLLVNDASLDLIRLEHERYRKALDGAKQNPR
jgi:hypothetical protein